MKQLTYISILCVLLVSCGPTSNIITSKSEAQKRGIYQEPKARTAVARTTSPGRTPVANRPNTTTRITTSNRANANLMASSDTPTPSIPSNAITGRKSVAESPRKNFPKSVLNEKDADDYEVTADNSSYVVMQLINSAESNLGAGYHTGGTNPDTGFDCSGLMFSTFKQFDITLPRSSNDMAKIGRKLDDSEIRKGDLIFFKTNGKSVINHVGMVTEVSDGEIKFIHSSTQKGVIISSTKEPYYERTFAQCNRIPVNL